MGECLNENSGSKQYIQTGAFEKEYVNFMYRFLIVVEKAKDNYSAYSPDLPGCVATGKTKSDAEKNMHKAIELHIHGYVEDRLPVPKPHAIAEYIMVR